MKLSKTELETLFFKACEDGNVDEVLDMIKDVDVNEKKGMERKIALHVCVEHNQVDVVNVLLQNGADVNAKVYLHRDTGLHIAAQKGYLDMTKVLIRNGIDVNAHNNELNTALHVAANYGHAMVSIVYGSIVYKDCSNGYWLLG